MLRNFTKDPTKLMNLKEGVLKGLAITPDGRQVYVPNGTENNLSIIDTSKKTVIGTIAVGMEPKCVAFVFGQLEMDGQASKDVFLTQTEFFNEISWSPFQQTPDTYEIYRGAPPSDLIGIVPGDVLSFTEHNLKEDEINSYFVLAKKGAATIAKGQVTLRSE